MHGFPRTCPSGVSEGIVALEPRSRASAPQGAATRAQAARTGRQPVPGTAPDDHRTLAAPTLPGASGAAAAPANCGWIGLEADEVLGADAARDAAEVDDERRALGDRGVVDARVRGDDHREVGARRARRRAPGSEAELGQLGTCGSW